MKYYIITGTSRGLGEAVANQLLSSNTTLFCISRSKNEGLITTSIQKGQRLKYIEYDLENGDGLDELMLGIVNSMDEENIESVCLINNAGIVNPIKPIGKCLSSDIQTNIKVNTIAPMILTNAFINHTNHMTCKKDIVNISSGAGKNPYFGWGSYCSSKAAIDMFTKCVGIEQVGDVSSVRIYSFSPGIIDTNMQVEIRQSNDEDFNQVKRFIKFKEEGLLRDAKFVAEKVVESIENKEIKTGMLVDIKDFLN